MSWNIDKSKDLYQIQEWSDDFFDINSSGNISIHPKKNKKHSIDLIKLVKKLTARGIKAPLLLRFTNIIESRLDLICSCFEKAIADNSYKSSYYPAYPIKVNQEKHLLDTLISKGEAYKLYIECGSKPELLIALGAQKKQGRIICNGFKDKDFIQLALYSQKLGHSVFIIIDRFCELTDVIALAKKLKVKPRIGFRLKLYNSNKGHWSGSLGHHAKFGLSAEELQKALTLLKKHKMLNCLEAAHFHPGSQVSSMMALKSCFREGAYLFTELYKAGAKNLKFLDVGGGLGVNYGTSDHKVGSIDYSEQEYANDMVYTLRTICDEKEVPHPSIISESGRALVAHSSMLIVECWGANKVYESKSSTRKNSELKVKPKFHRVVKELSNILNDMKENNINETYHDLLEKKEELAKLFSYGQISLPEKILGEKLYWKISSKLFNFVEQDIGEYESIHCALKKELKDTYFCNFSVFQSLPDLWAIEQPFPMAPLQKLDQKPDRWAQFADLTCDSDGRINRFIDLLEENGAESDYLPVHSLQKNKSYYLGIFLTGAYQEILGDLHNLFGDVNAIHISMDSAGAWEVEDFVPGDSNDNILQYVSYSPETLKESVRMQAEQAHKKKKIHIKDLKNILESYEKTISSSTYLE